jgi:hypothetical protein
MAVLIIAEVPGQTQEGYEGMIAALGPILKQAPGHLLHMSHPTKDGWRVIEAWESKADASAWFATYVAPNLPPGVRPKRTFHAVHTIISSELVRSLAEQAS